jgi:hypothetical protein
MQTKTNPSRLIGALLGVILFIGGVYFAFSYAGMKTTTGEPGDTQLHDASKASDRQTGLMMSLAAAGFGVVVMVLNRRK